MYTSECVHVVDDVISNLGRNIVRLKQDRVPTSFTGIIVIDNQRKGSRVVKMY